MNAAISKLVGWALFTLINFSYVIWNVYKIKGNNKREGILIERPGIRMLC